MSSKSSQKARETTESWRCRFAWLWVAITKAIRTRIYPSIRYQKMIKCGKLGLQLLEWVEGFARNTLHRVPTKIIPADWSLNCARHNTLRERLLASVLYLELCQQYFPIIIGHHPKERKSSIERARREEHNKDTKLFNTKPLTSYNDIFHSQIHITTLLALKTLHMDKIYIQCTIKYISSFTHKTRVSIADQLHCLKVRLQHHSRY